jgi:hypothetical protein
MLAFELEADDFETLVAEYPKNLKEALVSRLDNLNTELASRTAQSIGSLLNRVTGNAASSVEVVSAAIDGDSISGGITAGGDQAPYLIFQEEGTKGPYEILPVRAAALVFELNGRTVFLQRVLHPGLQARRPVGTAFDQFTPDILSGLQGVMDGDEL